MINKKKEQMKSRLKLILFILLSITFILVDVIVLLSVKIDWFTSAISGGLVMIAIAILLNPFIKYYVLSK